MGSCPSPFARPQSRGSAMRFVQFRRRVSESRGIRWSIRIERFTLVLRVRGLSTAARAEFREHQMKEPTFVSIVASASETATRPVRADKIIWEIKQGRWEGPVKEIRLLYAKTIL